MLSCKRNRATGAFRCLLAPGTAGALALLAAGCSADVTRFDFPAFGLTGGNSTGSLPSPSEPMHARGGSSYGGPVAGYGSNDTYGGSGGGDYGRAAPSSYPPTSYPRPSDRVATREPLDPPAGAEMNGPPSSMPPDRPARWTQKPPVENRPYLQEQAAPPPPASRPQQAAAGETIQVQQGDTLYGISKRYGVSIAALIELNHLTSGSSLKPGQQLVLPANGTTSRRVASRSQPERTASLEPPAAPSRPEPPRYEPAGKSAQPAAEPAPVAEASGPSHTIKAGESLYGIARQHHVTLAELMRINGITEPRRVRVGTVLRLPGHGGSSVTAERAPAPPAVAPPAPEAAPSAPQGQPGSFKVINPSQPPPAEPRREASRSDVRTDTPPVPTQPEAQAPSKPTPPVKSASADLKFRWPVRGRVISGFGNRPDGTHNDGINLAVPHGTDVHAAENGRVVYAGNELKGYGNLILIRHDSGNWVTAYAHSEQMLVKRDDVVKRGQVIAKAGKTGTVDQPQVHFELRQGSTPVDPTPYLEK